MRQWSHIALLAGTALAFYFVTRVSIDARVSPFDVGRTASRAELIGGGEGRSDRLAVIVVSAYCGASRNENLPDAWARIVSRETERHPGLRTVGVAVAAPTGVGIEFLHRTRSGSPWISRVRAAGPERGRRR